MGLNQLAYPHAIIFNDLIDDICQIENFRQNYNDRDLTEMCASSDGPEYLGMVSSSPDFTFDTPQFAAVLDRVDPAANGEKFIIRDLTGVNVDVEYMEAENLGMRKDAAATSHIRARMTNSCGLFWTGFSARQGQTAQLSCRMVTAWDGVASDPIIYTAGVAATTTGIAFTELYHLGPQELNGTALSGVTSLEWTNNVQLTTVEADGEEYATYHSIESVTPELTFRTNNTDYLTFFGQRGGLVATYTGYLRRHKEYDYFDTNVTASHIKFEADNARVRARSVGGSPLEVELSLRLKKQANGQYFDITTASAIT